MQKIKRTYEQRTSELIQKLNNENLDALNFQIIVKEIEIKRQRENIIKIEKRIISLYEDINTIQFLIDNKKYAK